MNSKTPPVLRPGKHAPGIHPVIAGRWSSRAIDAQKTVSPELLNRILEAGRWAPSSANNQPWRFMDFGPENAETLKLAKTTLAEGNIWAQPSPRLVFILARTDREDGKPHQLALYEAGQAVAQMALQAAHEGVVFHQMMGFSADQFRKLFSVPENFAIIVAVAIGWPGSSMEMIPENRRSLETSERMRKSMDELVFHNGEIPGK
ncbi:MAG: hypothetical protein B0D92_06145 [Spirochaeta sp. LUC14_002_19_P3]|nr:MAG: hypothetical protein B0D92_06145 [Spirochaeta sp. LUC14_002_19_P3]